MITFPLLNPSNSLRRALSVFSLSSFAFCLVDIALALATASISSINTIAFSANLALAKSSLTLMAPTPTYISTKSLPEAAKNATFASPATALAKRVLPVPGGPTNIAPLGTFAPKASNLSGFFKNSTISAKSSIASSQPATSSKVTLGIEPAGPSLVW